MASFFEGNALESVGKNSDVDNVLSQILLYFI